MKVQQFFPGSKSSQTQSTVRGARSTGPSEGKSADFAETLAGARKTPDPKPTETEAPASKKPGAASRKKQAANEQAEAPADDAVAAQDINADDPQPLPAAEEEQVSAETEEPIATAEGEADADEIVEVEADLSAIAMTPTMGPQAPVTEDAEQADVAEGSRPNPMPICPMPKPQGTVFPVEGTGESEQGTAGLSNAPEAVAGMVLEGFDDLIDEPVSDEDLDLAQAAAAQAPKTTGTSAPSIFADRPTGEGESGTTDKEHPSEQPLPTISSEFALADDVKLDDELSSSPAPVSKDATVSLSPMPVQPDTAKTHLTSTPASASPVPPQAQFAEVNHPKIVSAVQAQALTNGGTMQIRLDPPELGALQVLVHMTDGVMTASFQTSNDDATKLLSHSLSHLKAVLESQGVSVEKLQVQQAPKDQQAQNDDPRHGQQRDQHDDAHRQEQQRKEMLRRMWRKLSIGSDPLDLVA